MRKKFKLPFWSEMLNKQYLNDMSIVDLEKLGRSKGLELDKRRKKSTLVDQIYEVL
jgi:hypothetical protein